MLGPRPGLQVTVSGSRERLLASVSPQVWELLYRWNHLETRWGQGQCRDEGKAMSPQWADRVHNPLRAALKSKTCST